MTISKEKWKAYRETAKRREEEERRSLKSRFQKAWQVARLAATLLNKNFGVRKVFVFGSLLNEELFHLKSDIDLAVTGLDEKHYYRAQGQLLALDPEFEIDLILMEDV
jgi:predicted nucleotidyltransferase